MKIKILFLFAFTMFFSCTTDETVLENISDPQNINISSRGGEANEEEPCSAYVIIGYHPDLTLEEASQVKTYYSTTYSITQSQEPESFYQMQNGIIYQKWCFDGHRPELKPIIIADSNLIYIAHTENIGPGGGDDDHLGGDWGRN